MIAVRHIVNIFLDWDRDSLILSPEWIEQRFRLFQATTLKSLLAQKWQDFDIWVYCGLRNRAMTEAFAWHPRVTVAYDKGRAGLAALADQGVDFVALTRLDSDDLFHDRAIREVARTTPQAIKRNADRSTLIFRKNLQWDRNNEIIGFHNRVSPPFYTHVFPQRVFSRQAKFEALHFTTHGKSGAGNASAIELPAGRVCVMKHRQNISDIRRNRHFQIYTPAYIAQRFADGHLLAVDPVVIRRTMKSFGVTDQDYQEFDT